jgi:hypothetical protein
VEGGRGSLPSLPCRGGGGRGGAHSPFSPASPVRGYRVLSCSVLMIRVGRPWNLMLVVDGPWTPFVAAFDNVQ